MKVTSFFAAYALMTLLGNSVRADDVSRQLSKDGAWVLFHVSEEWESGTKRTYQFMISSVGQKVVRKERYRWIELKLRNEGDKSWLNVFKWLVPEKDLQLGGTAALAKSHGAWRKAWRKFRDREPEEVNLKDYFVRLQFFAPPPMKGAKKTGKTEAVQWQEGALKCDIATIRTREKFPADATDTIYRLKLHQRVPFGVAAAKLAIKSDEPNKGTIEYSLLEMGKNAKSEIPRVK